MAAPAPAPVETETLAEVREREQQAIDREKAVKMQLTQEKKKAQQLQQRSMQMMTQVARLKMQLGAIQKKLRETEEDLGTKLEAFEVKLQRREEQIEVLKVHNKQMLVGKVLGCNAILRFRFFKCLCLKSVQVGTHMTVSQCEFSKNTKMVNCHAIRETHFLLERKK